MRGRKQINKDLNDLHGNPSKRKVETKQNFNPSDKIFGIPKGLSKEVREKCREMAHYMESKGAPVEFMRPMFERYCKHLELAYKAFNDLNRPIRGGGFTDNETRKNPMNQVWKENSDSATRLESQFERIIKGTKPKEQKKDPLSEFMGKRGIKRVK